MRGEMSGKTGWDVKPATPSATVDGPISAFLDTSAKAINRAIFWPGRIALFVGGGALVLLMGITVADVVLRNLFSIVVPGGMELTGLLTILVALSTLGIVETERSHIRVDLVLRAMPEFVRLPTIAGALLLALLMMTVTAVQILQAGDLSAGQRHRHRPARRSRMAVRARRDDLPGAVRPGAPGQSGRGAGRCRQIRRCPVRHHHADLDARRSPRSSISPSIRRPSPSPCSRELRGILSISLCFVLIFLGVHVAAAMAVTALIGISLLIAPAASLTSLGTTTIDVVSDQTWSVVPLFTWMGLIVVASGFAEELYRAAYRWIGHLPGGLASASTVACAGLSSIVGDTLSGVYSMGSIALPQMRAYGYDMKLATASIACAATIGVMVPPSIAFIVYGMITEVSIGKLFIAGVLPGILFAVILIGLITIRAAIHPELAPRGATSSWKERLASSAKTWPVLVLMLLVLGGIYGGFVTPNEAGGLGIFGALLVAVLTRRLTWPAFLQSIERTLRLSAGIIVIFMFATAFSRFIAISGLTQQLANLVIGLHLGKYELISAILVFYVLIGMFMNALPALVLTVPLFFPIAMGAGFDPVWFGVVVVIMVELGVVTPPIGVNVFAIASMAKDVSMYDIFRGVFPFWIAFVVLIALIVLFPQISLFLPSLM